MHSSITQPRTAIRGRRLGRVATRRLLIGVVTLSVLATAGWYRLQRYSWSMREAETEMHEVRRGTFVQEVTARGDVESTENVEVFCDVTGFDWGTKILWVVPEGTYVRPVPDWQPDPANPDADPPDLLIKFNDSELKTRQLRQRSTCARSEAALIQARTYLETGYKSLKAYVEGTFKLEKKRANNLILAAEEGYRRAQEDFEGGEKLLAGGFITTLALEADRYAVEKAKKDLEAARTGLRVLEDYSGPKFIKGRQSDIDISLAGLEAKEQLHRINTDKLEWYDEQLELCTVRAPSPGQVVYANEKRHDGKQIVIEEGVIAWKHQVIVRLVDSPEMRIEAKVHEADMAMVREGMSAKIRIDAFPDMEFDGTVERINAYPVPPTRENKGLKQYETLIDIGQLPNDADGEPLKLRSGMTADVKIHVKTIPDVVLLPSEAILEHRGKHFCVQSGDESFQLREVKLGLTNAENAVILEGPDPGETVVAEAASYRDQLDPDGSRSGDPDSPLVHQVTRGPFVREITEQGEIESAENVEVECEVFAQGKGGSMILWVAPEGTQIEPAPDWQPDPNNPDEDPPDLLVKLDSAKLQDKITQEEIWCKTVKSVVVRSKNELEKAEISLQEYLGRFEQQKQSLEGLVFVARENVSRAEQRLEHEERLLARGYIPELAIANHQADVEKAQNTLKLAQERLSVLIEFTLPKNKIWLQATIDKAAAYLESEENQYELRLIAYDRTADQLAKCTIRAPAAGEVVYARTKNGVGQPVVIEEGAFARNKQRLIRLPNSTRMQVKAGINAGSIAMVREGMPVRIRVEAYKDLELTGRVQSVNAYADVASMIGTAIPEHDAIIEIDEIPKDEAGNPLNLRPGMTTAVMIRVEELSDVIQVPVQAIFEHGGKYYCLTWDGQTLQPRHVTPGPSNGQTAVILAGLEVEEQVVIGAAAYRDQVDLPPLD